jgi:hypothetical protein
VKTFSACQPGSMYVHTVRTYETLRLWMRYVPYLGPYFDGTNSPHRTILCRLPSQTIAFGVCKWSNSLRNQATNGVCFIRSLLVQDLVEEDHMLTYFNDQDVTKDDGRWHAGVQFLMPSNSDIHSTSRCCVTDAQPGDTIFISTFTVKKRLVF